MRQTDEELSFSEDAELSIYDTSDPDWTLVGSKGEYGFAPANYIEMEEARPASRSRPVPRAPEAEPEAQDPPTPDSPSSPAQNPAAALAGILAQRTGGGASAVAGRRAVSPPPAVALPPRRIEYTPEESDEEAPAPRLPQRPMSAQISPPPVRSVKFDTPASPEEPPGVVASPPYSRTMSMREEQEEDVSSPRGYHIYNIFEMVEVLGKRKKMPVTLGINIAKGIIMISAEKERSSKEWSADKLTHYSIEGKHVFMELVRPSKSIDFHAGAKDTAHEIVSALGELAGAARAEGLKEVFEASAGSTLKKGKMIYEFMSQGDDEVTVAEGDEVIILDDTKSEEWWMVRRIKNGKEGVVPSNYVDIIGTVPAPAPIASPTTVAPPSRNYVEENRREEERLAKEAAKRKKRDSDLPDLTAGLQLPKRHSSLMAPTDERSTSATSSKRNSKMEKKSMPNTSKVRTWTDRSGTFKVEAEFLGLRDEKIHLHKTNGVKIAVPVPKMSAEDLEFVERETGISLDELKPLSDMRRKASTKRGAGASVQKKPEYDWFDFFLQCGVDPQICERYSQAFNRDNIGEENMEDITPQLLRTLGFKEGDTLRVMKNLDNKFNRRRQDGGGDANGSLFSGPGGTLKNNTAKGRPAPPVETKNELDASLLKQSTGGDSKKATPIANAPTSEKATSNGFDDNAWEPRASKSAATASPPPATTAAASPPPAQPSVTPGMAEMSLLTAPLQPTPAAQPNPQAQSALAAAAPAVANSPQQTGATPSLFEQLKNAPPSQPKQRPNQPQMASNPAINSLISAPPGRSASAPQNPNQPGGFQPPPLQPQLTGYNMPLRMQTNAVPPGQSMSDIQQQRLYQQQMAFMQPQPTGYQSGFNQFPQNGLVPQPTGYMGGFQPQQTGFQNPSFQQAIFNGQQNGSPFADPPRAPFQPQATGFGGPQNFLQPQPTGVNSFLPPALQPQATGIGANQLGNQSFVPPPVPPIPQQAPAPLIPQKTGPPPPIRFGVGNQAKRLVSQPTGKRANLSNASKSPHIAQPSIHPLTHIRSRTKPLWFLVLVAASLLSNVAYTHHYLHF